VTSSTNVLGFTHGDSVFADKQHIRARLLVPDEIDFARYLRDTEPQTKVRRATEFLDSIMFQLAPATPERSRDQIQFAGTYVEFRPGELTIWAGFNDSGKSLIQGQVLTDFAVAGDTVCIASLEMKPEKTLARIAKQLVGRQSPTRSEVKQWLDDTDGRLWLYDQQGSVKPDYMVAVIKHCAEQLKCRHIAVDSMMKCVRGEDDYNGQKDFVDALTVCARDYNVHIHLVHHLRKGETDERMPTRMDLRGASAISDLADNVLLVWRNKKRSATGTAETRSITLIQTRS